MNEHRTNVHNDWVVKGGSLALASSCRCGRSDLCSIATLNQAAFSVVCSRSAITTDLPNWPILLGFRIRLRKAHTESAIWWMKRVRVCSSLGKNTIYVAELWRVASFEGQSCVECVFVYIEDVLFCCLPLAAIACYIVIVKEVGGAKSLVWWRDRIHKFT